MTSNGASGFCSMIPFGGRKRASASYSLANWTGSKKNQNFFFIVVVFLHQTSPYSPVTSDSWEEKEEPSASLLGDSSYHCVPLFCAPPGLKLG